MRLGACAFVLEQIQESRYSFTYTIITIPSYTPLGNSTDVDHALTCPMSMAQCTIETKLNALHQEVERLKEQVNTDPLTGLFNVRHLQFVLEQEMERTHRSHQPTTFILLDIDHFKRVNDTLGHIVGDKVLKHIAKILELAVRKIDVACRYGGEEFGVVLPSTPLLVGTQVAERIRKKIEDSPLELDGLSLPVTVSAGVDCFLHTQQKSKEGLIARVDRQLYLAKDKGRNCVCHSTDNIEGKAEVSADEKGALLDERTDKDA